MTAGSITIKVRPLRLAFVVDPSDRKGLQEAIKINSTLWGGAYNPIIPAFQPTPKKWESHRVRRLPTPADIVAGYIDRFDPDLVVRVGKCSDRNFDVGNRDIVTPSELFGALSEDGSPRYGIGIIDLLKDFVNKELKFIRTKPLEVIFPEYPKAYHLFLSSVFGILPESVQQFIDTYFRSYIGSAKVQCTIKDFSDYLVPEKVYPRRLNSWLLKRRLHDPQIFVCDATSVLDIIDYWNLRAACYDVIPIPIQVMHLENIKKFARDFIEEIYRPYRHNNDMYHRSVIQRSRSISEKMLQDFAQSLKIPKGENREEPKFLLRSWYPRLWNAWAREKTSEGITFPYSHEVEHSITGGQDRLELRSENPKLELSRRYSGKPKYANEFSFRFYEKEEPMAEVIPEGGRKLSSAIGRIHYDEWRFSKTGPVFLAKNEKDLIFLDIPRAEAVMIAWFSEHGWKVELSGPGRIAKQIIKQIGGRWGVSLLAHEGILRLFGELESERGRPWQAVISCLRKVIKEGSLFFGPEHYLERLLEVNALRLGSNIQCPICTRHNWVELDQLDYKLRCHFCLSTYEPPKDLPKDIKWVYRVYGPFALSVAQGAFTVLLTLKFLEGMHDPRITPLFSYKAYRDEKMIEADLTCLYKQSTWRDTQLDVIHAECKSFNHFEKDDISRMRILRDSFPGAALIFATLNVQLSNQEKIMISTFVLSERRKRLRGKLYSPVIVLTGNELFSLHGAPMCWMDKRGLYEHFVKSHIDLSELKELADATQQLYLSLPSFYDWERKQRIKKLNKK